MRRRSRYDAASVRTLFVQLDTDGSGLIDAAEFRAGMLRLGVKAPDDLLDKMYREADTDNSGGPPPACRTHRPTPQSRRFIPGRGLHSHVQPSHAHGLTRMRGGQTAGYQPVHRAYLSRARL